MGAVGKLPADFSDEGACFLLILCRSEAGDKAGTADDRFLSEGIFQSQTGIVSEETGPVFDHGRILFHTVA